jgi:hypothetical protein
VAKVFTDERDETQGSKGPDNLTGIRPRGFVLKALVDSQTARRELAARWGYPVAPGQSKIHSRHDRVQAEVHAGGAGAGL